MRNNNKKPSVSRLIIVTGLLLLLNSCLGAAADITIRADGSGNINLEYRVSQTLESMGRLDGNERWPTIPVGKADFQRSVARVPGLSLSSFSVKDVRNGSGGSDRVTKVSLDFKNIEALAAFLDSSGSRASLVQDNGKNTLRLVALDPADTPLDADLLSLIQEIAAGYEISFSFNLPREAGLSLIPQSVPAVRLAPQGKKVSFSIPVGELLTLKDGLTLQIDW